MTISSVLFYFVTHYLNPSNFGFDVPIALKGIDNKFLNPRENWLDKVSYDKEVAKLVKLFSDNFEQYLPFVDEQTKAAAIG